MIDGSQGNKLKAAIIGLGKVGLIFDEELERKKSGEVWTHFTAYQKLAHLYELVAVVDPDEGKHEIAKSRKPDLNCFRSVQEMLSFCDSGIDVVSICTPVLFHLSCLEQLIGKVKAVFLEKPMCELDELEKAEEVVGKLKESGTCIRINYYKQKEPLFKDAIAFLKGETIHYMSAKYSGPFEAVGSHALNLLVACSQELGVLQARSHRAVEGYGVSAQFQIEGDWGAVLSYCGLRHSLIFELDIISENKRTVLEDNFSVLRSYSYQKSRRYQDYRELALCDQKKTPPEFQRFTEFLEELAYEIEGGSNNYDNLNDSMRTLQIMRHLKRECYE
jgi:predicted dehydrogenase